MKRREDGKFGVIYVLKMGEHYKIGKASLSFTRLGEYTKLPETPEYIYVGIVLNALVYEEELHELFKHKRIRGEWFNLNNQDLNTIGLFFESNCLFRVDDDGILNYNLDKPTQEDLLLKALRLYKESKKFNYDENYVLSILKQQNYLRERFKKYDETIPHKITYLFDTKNNVVMSL